MFCLHNRNERLHKPVVICLVGKYTSLEDAYTSVGKALRHAALYCRYKLELTVSLIIAARLHINTVDWLIAIHVLQLCKMIFAFKKQKLLLSILQRIALFEDSVGRFYDSTADSIITLGMDWLFHLRGNIRKELVCTKISVRNSFIKN